MDMKTRILFRARVLIPILSIFMTVTSCGPIVFTAGTNPPPPPWFYPNRLEVVRYVYFPNYSFYYDLSARNYIYLEGNVWVRRRVLPPRYSHLDLRRTKYERIKGYQKEDIRSYHEEHNANRGRSNRSG